MTALVLTLGAKTFNDKELCKACLASGNTTAISTGETNKNVTVRFLKKHMAYVNFTSVFFAVFNSSTQNIQFPKNQTHCTYSLCSGRKDKDCKNLAHTSKTRQVKHPKSVLFNRGSAKHVVGFRDFQGFREGSPFYRGNYFLLQYVDASL